MHGEIRGSGITHGKLKPSTSILFGKNMGPCITEYGLMMIENQAQMQFLMVNISKTGDLVLLSMHIAPSKFLYIIWCDTSRAAERKGSLK